MADEGSIGRLNLLLEVVSDWAPCQSVDELFEAVSRSLSWVLSYDGLSIAIHERCWHHDADGASLEPCAVDALSSAEAQAIELTRERGLPSLEDERRVLSQPLLAETPGRGAIVLRSEATPYTMDDVKILAHVAEFLTGMVVRCEQAETIRQQALQLELAGMANRTKDEFLAILGHELRNPLAPIVSATQLLRERLADPPAELSTIDRHAQHLASMLDDLSDVARLTRGTVELQMSIVDLAQVLTEAVQMCRSLLDDREHRLTMHLPSGSFPTLGEERRLLQVFSNLVSNAARYTPRGGNIHVRLRRSDGMLITEVEDDGIGIEPDAAEVIFELFEQGPRTYARTQGGLGLGLGIVKGLTAAHGGTVAVRSEGQGRGSTFSVALPEAAADLARTSDPTSSAPRSPRDDRVFHVLVVDDNEDAAELLGSLLEAQGHTVTSAHDGASALAALETAHPDVAILDLGLPGMDGYELGQEIRRRLKDRAPPLVAFTGYAREQDRARGEAAGFQAHLVKPVKLEQILRTIRQVVGRTTT